MFLHLVFLLVIGVNSHETSSIITFPTSFTGSEHKATDSFDVKNCYRKVRKEAGRFHLICFVDQQGIEAVQNVAGLVQNILLQESVNFATKNWIISPLSLAGVFAQLLMGSRGEIRHILSNALSFVDDGRDFTKLDIHRQLGDLLKYLRHNEGNDYILLLSNAVFLQNGFPLKATYKHALTDFYSTPIIPVDFSDALADSVNKVNEWIRNSTENHFSDLIILPLSPNTISIMASVIYYKGSWEMPFDPDYTQPGWFFTDENRKVRTKYMYGEQEILYGNTSDYQLIGLPFKSRDVVLYILLPNGRFSTRVAIKQFDRMASSARLENVTLVLPKIKLTTTISVKDAISKYLRKGANTPRKSVSGKSNDNACRLKELDTYSNSPVPLGRGTSSKTNEFDMSGASEDIRFKIDDILHKVSFEMDEHGTELVGATYTLVDHSGSDFIVKVNRPFLFFVRHETTVVHLFWGFVSDPSSHQ